MRTTAVTRLEEMAREWESFAAQLHARAGASEAAAAYKSAAGDLRALAQELDGHLDETLTLIAASRECGYSSRQLRRMIERGEIPNEGRKNAPRVRRRHLPRKPGQLTRHQRWTQASAYDDFGRTARVAEGAR